MAQLIKDKQIVADTWLTLELGENDTAESIALPAGDVIFPFAVWQAAGSRDTTALARARAETLAQRNPAALDASRIRRMDEIAARVGAAMDEK